MIKWRTLPRNQTPKNITSFRQLCSILRLNQAYSQKVTKLSKVQVKNFIFISLFRNLCIYQPANAPISVSQSLPKNYFKRMLMWRSILCALGCLTLSQITLLTSLTQITLLASLTQITLLVSLTQITLLPSLTQINILASLTQVSLLALKRLRPTETH